LKKLTFRSLLTVLLIVALLAPVGALSEELELPQETVGAEDNPLLLGVEDEALLPETALSERLELAQANADAAQLPNAVEAQPSGAEAAGDAVANGAKKLTVSGKKTVKLKVGVSYQLVVPGRKIERCKSANSKVVKAYANGLITVRKKGRTTVTVKAKGKKAFVLTVKAVKAPVELSGYFRKNAKNAAKKLGLTKKKNGTIQGYNGSLKYTRYYKGGVSLYNFHFANNDGEVHRIRIEDTAAYTLVGVHVGMPLEQVRKKLKKYEYGDSFYDFGDQLYYVIEWGPDMAYVRAQLNVGYWNGKVNWLEYGAEID